MTVQNCQIELPPNISKPLKTENTHVDRPRHDRYEYYLGK